jgi:hypothetical protein
VIDSPFDFRFFRGLFGGKGTRAGEDGWTAEEAKAVHALSPAEGPGGVALQCELRTFRYKGGFNDVVNLETESRPADLDAPQLERCPFPLRVRPWIYEATDTKSGVPFRQVRTTLLTFGPKP